MVVGLAALEAGVISKIQNFSAKGERELYICFPLLAQRWAWHNEYCVCAGTIL